MKRTLRMTFCTLISLSSMSSVTLAQRLQYDLAKDQKASFEYDIQIDTSANLISYTGIVNYSVTLVNDQLVRLTFQGGLSEQTKPNPNRGSDNAGHLSRPFILPSIFTRSNFAGKGHSRNTIGMTRAGQVLTLDGTSQLPFMLGNLSLIPFEQLPAEEIQTWKSDAGVSITEESSTPRFTVRPFGPFAFQPPDRMQSATEVTTYKVLSNESGIATIEKNYEMKTPDTGDRESFQMVGKGTWRFDLNDHLPSATDMKYSLTIKDGNTTTVFPIRLKFSKLTAERLEAMQAEAKANLEKAQKLAEERKAAANKPITGKELEEIVANLNSSQMQEKHAALFKLSQRENIDADPKLVEAIRKIVKSGDTTASLADNILQKLDPIHRINKRYEGPGFVDSSNLPIDSSTELYVGQIVQIKEYGSSWYPGEITEVSSDGKVNAIYRGWGQRNVTLLRNQIQLAHKEVVQPKRPNKSKQSKSPKQQDPIIRSWADSSGSFKIEAAFIGVDGDKVVLKKTDGKEITVALARLSVADQRFVAQTLEDAKKLGNPFDPQ